MLVSGMFQNLQIGRFVLIKSSFAEKVLKALNGEKGIVEPTFIYLPGVPGGEAIAKETGLDFFSVPVELGVCFFPLDMILKFRKLTIK